MLPKTTIWLIDDGRRLGRVEHPVDGDLDDFSAGRIGHLVEHDEVRGMDAGGHGVHDQNRADDPDSPGCRRVDDWLGTTLTLTVPRLMAVGVVDVGDCASTWYWNVSGPA